jgi:hypothetical protein
MILDADLEFSDAQSVVKNSGLSQVSTDVYDHGSDGLDGWGSSQTPDIGEGGTLEFNVQVATLMAGASAAIDAKLVTKASSAAISSGGTTLATLNFPAASAAGTKKSIKVPSGTIQRFLGVVYTASGGNVTASAFDAWIGLDHQT